jgi:serine/threonine protein kinase
MQEAGLSDADFDRVAGRVHAADEFAPRPLVTTTSGSSFRVLGLLGRGTSADVFLVVRDDEAQGTGSYYAMKRSSKKKLSARRTRLLVEEVDIIRGISHPFIIRMHETFQTERYVYLALTYAGGGDLSLWLEALTPPCARTIAAEILLALEYLHAAGVIYRDLKPENTLVSLDGHILLADFGASKRMFVLDAADSDPTTMGEDFDGQSTRTVVGTLPYMAPEQWRKQPYSIEVDFWSMAVMLHEMLTGETVLAIARSRSSCSTGWWRTPTRST